MSTIWVECWKCDECGFRWIKDEVWPDRCKSSACRSRKWNSAAKLAGEPAAVSAVASEAVTIEPVVADEMSVSRPSLADLRAVVAALEQRPAPAVALPIMSSTPVRTICGFKAYNDIDGEDYTCGLPAHDWKVKHSNWIKT